MYVISKYITILYIIYVISKDTHFKKYNYIRIKINFMGTALEKIFFIYFFNQW